ncbi:CinA family protein [Corynebacterium alimapuense]|uniref:CinA C-terminal domain-containing protein n=1 Tax=Corynebacterium alimapuense TaxID=1576874 RepID=A0A3M8K7Z2_9CORY|nr:nicotinamide-nucleotide amidohydrolase family protein [Corynebacterium alimapuense]RNE49351.1 hypothetical protein C5L39_03015 [Corynebacterium alimapuense]
MNDPTTAAALVAALSSAGLSVSFCESLTAGLAAATVADIPGASAVLRGGLITYATELKSTLAGVPVELLATHGPVASETAAAMAVGCRKACASDWAVSLTGIAGPDTQDEHPVGQVWLGFATDGDVSTAQCQFSGSRREIRKAAVEAALAGLLARL